MDKKLIHGGIYTVKDDDLYYIFMKDYINDFNTEFKHYKFFIFSSDNHKAIDLWEELALMFLLNDTNGFSFSDMFYEFIYTEEKMFETINGFLGVIPKDLKEKLDKVFEEN